MRNEKLQISGHDAIILMPFLGSVADPPFLYGSFPRILCLLLMDLDPAPDPAMFVFDLQDVNKKLPSY
jgi:hypothetical protein